MGPTGSKRPAARLGLSRRAFVAGAASAAIAAPKIASATPRSVAIGVTPLILDDDIRVMSLLENYLDSRLARPVQLVRRRTYQEITTMLLSGQLDAAWICDDPYVQHEDQLSLLAVPVYQGQPLYQTYVIVNETSDATDFDGARGTVHAFSDPDSTSGFLVTRYLLALRQLTPERFFRETFFTYGHRNVVRAVASGLAQSGSVDGYVWNVLSEREPQLTAKTRVVYKSERLGFPPIAGPRSPRDPELAKAIAAAFLAMAAEPSATEILGALKLDGFTEATPDLYTRTRDKWLLVKEQS